MHRADILQKNHTFAYVLQKATYFIILATLTEVDLDTFWPLTRMIRSPLRSPESSALDAENRKYRKHDHLGQSKRFWNFIS